MRNKVLNTIKKYDMLGDAEAVTVALSGGADSVCLLHILYSLREELGITLQAAHLNHNLRGEESDRDEQFVRRLCEELEIPLAVGYADVKTEAEKRGESIELTARNIRYGFLKDNAIGLVATAHTASDNLETVIYNTVRGSGTRGIAGIPPKRDIYIRPLIGCTREEVEAYLCENGLTFVTDSSNLTDEYSRNFIRHKVIPALKQINPSAEQTVAAASVALREDADFIDGMALKIYAIISKGDSLDAELLLEQHPAVAKRVLAMFHTENVGENPDSLHIKGMYDVLKSGGRLSLRENFSAVCDKKTFKIVKNQSDKPVSQYKTELLYNNVYNLLLKNTIDCDKIKGSLTVRTRREGDFIRLDGRGCTKSLKKLFCELKIPNDEREILPVVSDDEGVVFIYSVGIAERVKPDGNTKNMVTFKVSKTL